MLLSASFTAKFCLIFALALENEFSKRFHFKDNRKSIDSSEKGTRDFQNSSLFERSECFQYFNFETLTFWKTKTFFKKLKYRFFVESINIENASFPYNTATSEANVKTNRMVSTKWTYHKEWIFARNYFILFFNFVSV